MAQLSTLLELRNKIKDKKPDFIRQDYQRRKRLGRKLKWRKPKGIHSKIRHHFKGRRKMPSPGYKSPLAVKGLHASGLKIIKLSSVADFKKIKNESEGIVVSRNVGMRKRLDIFKKAKELNIAVLNSNVDAQIKKIEDFIASKKKPREVKKEEPKEIRRIVTEQKDVTEISIKEKREAEKNEKDRILTKKV